MSHFLTQLEVAREHQEEAQAFDTHSRAAAATQAERTVVALCKELEDALAGRMVWQSGFGGN